MNIHIYKNIDASVPAQDNALWSALNKRTQFVSDPQTPVTETYMDIMTTDRNIVFYRDAKLTEVSVEDANGDTIISTPMKETEIEEESTAPFYIVTPQEVIVAFSFKGNPNEETRLMLSQSIKGVLSEKILEKEITGFDFISIAYKKLATIDTNVNNTGFTQFVSLKFNNDEHAYRLHLMNFGLSIDFQQPINETTIGEEISDYSIDQFIKDFANKFKSKFQKIYNDEEVLIDITE
jgi:hypothetical protein